MTKEILHPGTHVIACSIDGDIKRLLRDLPGEGPWSDEICIPIRLEDRDGWPGEDIATLHRRVGDEWELRFEPGFERG